MSDSGPAGVVASLLTILAPFVLTTVAGGYIAQRWQRSSWQKQQTRLARDKELDALRDLANEIARLGATRLYQTHRLAGALGRSDGAAFEAALEDYASAVSNWMTNLQSFYIRLGLLVSYQRFALRLERDVHTKFYEIGVFLESSARARKRDLAKTIPLTEAVRRQIQKIEPLMQSFNQDLMREIVSRRDATYYGEYIAYEKGSLGRIPSHLLFKALLEPRVNGLRILRPASSLGLPSFSWD